MAIVGTLLQDAQIFAFDEPSAFIDVEDRIVLAKAIQRFVRSMGKTALIIDHDIQLVDIVADSLMIFSGEPGRKGRASKPLSKNEGMNTFSKSSGSPTGETSRRDGPRVNKPESKLDRMQKSDGKYYYVGKMPTAPENEKTAKVASVSE